jgi:hypothetical protein
VIRLVVYADEYCRQAIKKFALNVQLSEQAYDFQDGEDWWNPILDQIESNFGLNWGHVFMTSLDGSKARMFSRRVKNSGGNDFLPFIQPMLIGFSDDLLDQRSIGCGSDRYQQFDLTNFDFNRCYLDISEQFNLSGLDGRSQLLSLDQLLRSESKRLLIQFEMDFIPGFNRDII